jgi:hypothetical protein
MRRLTKIAIAGFLGYAVATASPAQQSAIIGGTLAIKDAAVDACTRDGALCTGAISSLTSGFSSLFHDRGKRWMDEEGAPERGER